MHEFSYLPYFPSLINSDSYVDFRINGLHLFNFWKYKDVYLQDDNLKQTLESLCAMYVDADGRTLSRLTIAIIDDNYSLLPLTDAQREDLNRYILAFSFCTVVNNMENSAWASEHFTLYHQRFSPGQNMITYTAGSYVRLTHMTDISDKRFHIPDYIVDSLFFRYDEKLFQAFANMVDAHRSDDDHLFKVLEWVRFACSNVGGYSPESRLVMLTTAFEIFFQLPRNNKETEFVNRLELLLDVGQMEIPLIQRETRDGRNKSNTIYGWWARDLYWVRSEVVHCGALNREDFSNHNRVDHLLLALKMLRICYYHQLEELDYLTYRQDPDLGPFADAQRMSTMIDLREIEHSIKFENEVEE